MTTIILTPQMARAAATDAGNRSMRAAGRTAWDETDYDAACAEYERLARSIGHWVEPLTRAEG